MKRPKSIPIVSVNSAAAKEPIAEITRKIRTYQNNPDDTVGKGGHIQVPQTIGDGVAAREEWIDVDHSNRVTVRWIFLREIQRRHRKAAHLCDIELPKFDALIEYNSPAADVIREAADKIAAAYAEHSVIIQNSLDDPFEIGPIPVDKTKLVRFDNAVHEGYSELNDLEKDFAAALDKTKKVWCRNPSQGGFEIPLLDRGNTKTFNPDFLFWADNKRVIAIDTKGDHLIIEDSGRKLFHIELIGNGPRLEIRLVTEGEWHAKNGEIGKLSGSSGYTVWSLRHGKIHPTHCRTIAKAVEACCI